MAKDGQSVSYEERIRLAFEAYQLEPNSIREAAMWYDINIVRRYLVDSRCSIPDRRATE